MTDTSSLQSLARAIRSYSYPCVVYDFRLGQEIQLQGMVEVERFIQDLLMSTDIEKVKDGLSNILFWGYYRSPGRRNHRVQNFRTRAEPHQLARAVTLFASLRGCAIRDLKRLDLPQFSHMSFLSKLRMFLDPSEFCVIDRNLCKIPAIARRFSVYPTYIPATEQNEESYSWWVKICGKASDAIEIAEHTSVRPVDAERGFFQLVDDKQIVLADSLIRKLV
jgi:hypothetical protein